MSWAWAIIALQLYTVSWLWMWYDWRLHAPAFLPSFLWQVVPSKGRKMEQEKESKDEDAELSFLNITIPTNPIRYLTSFKVKKYMNKGQTKDPKQGNLNVLIKYLAPYRKGSWWWIWNWASEQHFLWFFALVPTSKLKLIKIIRSKSVDMTQTEYYTFWKSLPPNKLVYYLHIKIQSTSQDRGRKEYSIERQVPHDFSYMWNIIKLVSRSWA